MSAALTLPRVWARGSAPARRTENATTKPLSSVAFYRKHTEALLRRYMYVSMHMGRVPSVLGNCMLRGMVSSYRVHSFEDAIIFIYDVEKCLKRLDPGARDLIARVTLQEYTQAEAAELTGQSLRSVVRKYAEAIDRLTGIFLELQLLQIERL